MAVLLIAEHDNVSLKDATHKALTAAAKMGGEVHVLVAGHKAEAAAKAAAKLSGVKKVLHVESADLERPLAEPMAANIVALASTSLRRPHPMARTSCRAWQHFLT
jgi:electron transfer flavoprotein alpha subunit